MLNLYCICAILVTIIVATSGLNVLNKSSSLPNCTEQNNKTIQVYRGWPFRFEFPEFALRSSQIRGLSSTYTLTILSGTTGREIYNFTGDSRALRKAYYETEDLSDSIDTEYVIVAGAVNVSFCKMSFVSLNLTNLPNITCNQSLAEANIVWAQTLPEVSRTTPCFSRSGSHKVRLDQTKHNYTIQWLYNCSANLPDGATEKPYTLATTKYLAESLYIPRVGRQHAGVYTCAVTYNGMTQYVTNVAKCIKIKDATEKPEIKCSKKVYLVKGLGQNVTINCSVLTGYGLVSTLSSAMWNKTDNDRFECYSLLPGHRNAEGNTTHYCSREDRNPKFSCFKRPPTQEQLRPLAAYSIVQLYLTNMQENDLGLYTLQVVSASNERVLYHVRVELDQTEPLRGNALALGVGLGVLGAFILVFATLGFFCSFYIGVLWKRHFAPFECDDRRFGAFLSYHYSKEIDTFAQRQVGEVCEAVRDQLESSGFSVYDEYRDGNAGYRAESSTAIMGNSHRILVVLTPDYVRDNWSVFQLQQGFKKMIDSGSKMIFILTPGMREYIVQQSAQDSTYTMIRRAIRTNHVISWPCEDLCCPRRFSLELERCMPKLDNSSSSASGKSSRSSSNFDVGYHPATVDRVLSTTTTTTEIGSDVFSFTNEV